MRGVAWSGLVGRILRLDDALESREQLATDIAVDDTLHFVAQLRRSAGSDRLGAAMLRAGPGLVLTSLVLGLGFAVLLGSAFLPLRAMGGLLMATSATALIADVVVLPAALRLTGWERATLGRAA